MNRRTGSDGTEPIIDTHQHLWDLHRFRLPWLAGAGAIARSFLPEDYQEATAGLNVRKTVYMEVDVEPGQQEDEVDYVTRLCQQDDNPMAAAVIAGRPAAPDFAAYLARFEGSPWIKGVRQVLHGEGTPPGYCLSPEFLRGIRLLGEKGLCFDICIRPAELGDAVRLVDACPETRFILDHCGNADPQAGEPRLGRAADSGPNPRTSGGPGTLGRTPGDRSQWEREIAALAERPNVVCKVSGIIARATPDRPKAEQLAPIVRHVMAAFGPDRVMFGGDWPVCLLGGSYREWVEALREIVQECREADRRKLFHDNAARFYGL